ncbi:MAG: Asp23/Gls24 family envelope stress response protein [Ruminococcaceae bacterium]|nr:Asp23/Gls24 family envelope stress response protein [Oscillospiraceae bacterium]
MSDYNNFSSGLTISEEVIATIAINAAKDVEGVVDLGNRPTDVYTAFKINADNLKHVKVTLSDYDIKLQVFLILSSSAQIPEVSVAVQNAIKSAVQNMTGRLVTKVDVTITGISDDIPELVAPAEPKDI